MFYHVRGLGKRGLAIAAPIVWTVATWSDWREQGVTIGTVFVRPVRGWVIDLRKSFAGRGKDATAMTTTRERAFVGVGNWRKGGVAVGAEFHLR